MTAAIVVLKVLLLVASGILAGGMVDIAAAQVPSWRHLALGPYVRVHQLVDHHIDRFMPKSAAVAALAAIALLLLSSLWVRALLLLGVVMVALVALISELGNKPLNRTIGGWNADEPPPETEAVRALWARRHLARTVPGVLALVAFATAIVFDPRPGA